MKTTDECQMRAANHYLWPKSDPRGRYSGTRNDSTHWEETRQSVASPSTRFSCRSGLNGWASSLSFSGDSIMHTLDLGNTTGLRPVSSLPEGIQSCFSFTSSQQELSLTDPNIADLVARKTANKEFFYGIEILAHNEGKVTCVDFNLFLPILPSLISIVWSKQFSESIRSTNMNQITSMQMIPHLNTRISAMPHLSLYRLTQKDLDAFLALNLTNVLVIRGDFLHEEQEYRYAYQVVEYLRRARGSKYFSTYLFPISEMRLRYFQIKYLLLWRVIRKDTQACPPNPRIRSRTWSI